MNLGKRKGISKIDKYEVFGETRSPKDDEVMKKVRLYTDGSALGNPGYGGYAGILLYKGFSKVVSGGEINATNNQMELMAVIAPIQTLKEKCRIYIYSDSKYVVNGVNVWIRGWYKNNWKRKGNKEIVNVELWKKLHGLMQYHNITADWVKGHNDNEYNEYCDKIARDEAYKIKV